MTMIDSEPEIDLAKLAAVSAPALVLQGTGMRSRWSMGPRVPRLWEMAGLRCFRHARRAGRTARNQPAAHLVPCAERCAALTEDFLRQGPGDERLRHSGACQRI
jgi:hypothetical protein